ncbi:MAG: phosphotransferase [Firmicutes bacterium]|nr:phosphotransferase [Bacillota bacterium]
MIDIHTHILPAIDDGSPDLSTSCQIIITAATEGVTKIIATPHYWPGVYQPHWREVLQKTEQLNNELSKKGNSITILPGMEVHLDIELPRLLEKGIIGTLNNTGKYLLVELPAQSFPHYSEMVLCKLLSLGITPILAHPERNSEVINNPEILYSLLEKGVLIQLTAASITGAFGRRAMQTSTLMLEYGWVHFIASDCHDIDKRPYVFLNGIEKAETILSKNEVELITRENPEKLIAGEDILTRSIKPIEKNVIKNRNKRGKKLSKQNFILRTWNLLTNKNRR